MSVLANGSPQFVLAFTLLPAISCGGTTETTSPVGTWIQELDSDQRPIWACFQQEGHAGVGYEQPTLDLKWDANGTPRRGQCTTGV